MFTNKKREGINRFVCDVSLCVAEIPKVSIKDHEPLFPIIPFGIVAYGFVGQPFSKQLYIETAGPFTSRFEQSNEFFFPRFAPGSQHSVRKPIQARRKSTIQTTTDN